MSAWRSCPRSPDCRGSSSSKGVVESKLAAVPKRSVSVRLRVETLKVNYLKKYLSAGEGQAASAQHYTIQRGTYSLTIISVGVPVETRRLHGSEDSRCKFSVIGDGW